MHDIEEFMKKAHGEQLRKYSGLPYWTHPIEVRDILLTVPHTEAMLKAALLHDVVEDTSITIEEVEQRFGSEVAEIVSGLTDVSRPEDGNRKLRKQKDLEHTAMQSPETKTVKLADLISNSRSIFFHAKDNKDAKAFAKLYAVEKQALLNVLTEGDSVLLTQAKGLLESYTEWIAQESKS